MLPFTLAGVALFYGTIRKQKSPADESNRLNKLILVWYAISREDLFTDILPFLKKDLLENFRSNDNADKLTTNDITQAK